MSDLVAWVRAQLDATEAAAKAADVKQGDPDWRVSPVLATGGEWFTVRSKRDSRPIARVQRLDGDDGEPGEILDGAAVAAHIALHDPAAVLADVEAKRAILDEHPCAPAYDDSLYETTAPKVCSTCDHHEITGEWTLWPCKTVRLLAEGFRGRPGYEEACGE